MGATSAMTFEGLSGGARRTARPDLAAVLVHSDRECFQQAKGIDGVIWIFVI
jgi:hypothetical protein